MNYTQAKTKLSRKSENAVADDRVLKFLYDADLRHVESSVRCHRKYKKWSHTNRSRINNLYLLTRPIRGSVVKRWLFEAQAHCGKTHCKAPIKLQAKILCSKHLHISVQIPYSEY